MTEQEWLVSTDPAAMLRYAHGLVGPGGQTAGSTWHNRQLRLFEEARWWGGFLRTDRDQGGLIRCVFGNPWWPVLIRKDGDLYLHTGSEKAKNLPAHISQAATHHYECVDWLTPAVLALARAADAGDASALLPLADALLEAGCPAEVACPKCGGSGGTGYGKFGPCPACDGTGRVPSPLLAHLRQPVEVACPECGGNGGIDYAGPRERKQMLDCPACRGTGRFAQPHALPGCHVLSLLLNKE